MGYETMTANENSAFRVLRESDLKAILNVPTAMEIIERTFFDYGAGDTQRLSDPPSLFVRSASPDSGELLVKGATHLCTNRHFQHVCEVGCANRIDIRLF